MGNVNMEAHQIHCKGNKTLADKLVELDAIEQAVQQETVTVTKEENDTYGTMLARLAGLVDFDKIKATSTLVVGTKVYQLATWTSTACTFIGAYIEALASVATFSTLKVSASGSYSELYFTAANFAIRNNTGDAAPDAMTIYY